MKTSFVILVTIVCLFIGLETIFNITYPRYHYSIKGTILRLEGFSSRNHTFTQITYIKDQQKYTIIFANLPHNSVKLHVKSKIDYYTHRGFNYVVSIKPYTQKRK